VQRYWFPDQDNGPEPAIDIEQPASVPANENRPITNDNRPAPQATRTIAVAAGGKARPWAK
jgi:hypothetical protein